MWRPAALRDLGLIAGGVPGPTMFEKEAAGNGAKFATTALRFAMMSIVRVPSRSGCHSQPVSREIGAGGIHLKGWHVLGICTKEVRSWMEATDTRVGSTSTVWAILSATVGLPTSRRVRREQRFGHVVEQSSPLRRRSGYHTEGAARANHPGSVALDFEPPRGVALWSVWVRSGVDTFLLWGETPCPLRASGTGRPQARSRGTPRRRHALSAGSHATLQKTRGLAEPLAQRPNAPERLPRPRGLPTVAERRDLV